MEAATTDGARRGARWPWVVLAILLGLIAFFFAYVAIDVAGTQRCEEALAGDGGDELFIECVDKSATNQALTVVASALTALAALAAGWLAIVSARRRARADRLGVLLIAVVVLGAITVAL